MIDLNDYFYFVQVVEKQGFSAAAEVLGMPKSRLSRHVKNLEERLDTVLIQRTSRQFHITDSGRLFYQHARSLIDEMELAETVMQQQKRSVSGRVSVSCSVGVAQFALQPLMIRFLEMHPQLQLVQHVTNQPVDLIAAGIDMAIRGHAAPLPDSSLIQRHLASVPWHLFTGPSYIEKYGRPTSPYDLFKQRVLKVGWQPSQSQWSLESRSGVKVSVPFDAVFSSDDMGTLKEAAHHGLGIVALPAYTCTDELAQNKLVRILPEWNAGIAELTLLLPTRKGFSGQAQLLRDYLLSEVSEHLAFSN